MKYDHATIELSYTEDEENELKLIEMFKENMPFFQDSLFHYRLGKYIDYYKIEGDFVECGVYNGTSSASIALALKNNKKDSKIYLYDSWEGFPETTILKDGERASTIAGGMVGSLIGTQMKMEKTGFPKDNIIYKKGWFKDTFLDENKPEKISLLHVDCDFHDSVLLTLETFYDKVTNGGLIILDDFGAFFGCRVAFYEFCEKIKIRPLIRTYDHTRVFWNKTNVLECGVDNTIIMDNSWQNYIKLLRDKI